MRSREAPLKKRQEPEKEAELERKREERMEREEVEEAELRQGAATSGVIPSLNPFVFPSNTHSSISTLPSCPT